MTQTDSCSKDDLCQKIVEYIEGTKDFLLEQTPEVVQQAVRFEKISAITIAVLMFILLLAAIACFMYFWKNPVLDKYDSRDMVSFLGMLLPGCICPLFFISLCYKIEILMKICISPKYFIIEIFKALID